MIEIDAPAGILRLRPEKKDDADFRFSLFCQSREPPWAALAAAPGFDALLRMQFSAQNAAYARSRLFIVEGATSEDNLAPIGRLALDKQPRRLTLVDLALLPQWRGRGLGSALIRHLQVEARRFGAPLHLSVAKTNVAAERLYRRLGFVDAAGDEVYAQLVWRAEAAQS